MMKPIETPITTTGSPDEAREVVGVQRDAGVVERRDGMEDPRIGRGDRTVLVSLLPEPEEEDGGEGSFDGQGDLRDRQDEVAQVAHVDGADLGLGEHPLSESDAIRRDDGEHRPDRHDAEPADLDEEHDDDLAEQREVGRRRSTQGPSP